MQACWRRREQVDSRTLTAEMLVVACWPTGQALAWGATGPEWISGTAQLHEHATITADAPWLFEPALRVHALLDFGVVGRRGRVRVRAGREADRAAGLVPRRVGCVACVVVSLPLLEQRRAAMPAIDLLSARLERAGQRESYYQGFRHHTQFILVSLASLLWAGSRSAISHCRSTILSRS